MSWCCGWTPCCAASGERAPAGRGPVADGDLSSTATRTSPPCAGDQLALTVREFDLLRFLVAPTRASPTRATSCSQEVWGWSFGDQSTVTVHVRRLREKVEQDPTRPTRLVTVWGVGYAGSPVDDA